MWEFWLWKNTVKDFFCNKWSLLTELVLCAQTSEPTRRSLDSQLKLKLNGKRLYETSSVKYLGIKMGQYLIWQDITNIAIKLNKVNVMLHKVRQFLNEGTSVSIYRSIFDSHLNYAWGQTKSSINRVFIIKKKAIRDIHFKAKFDHTSSLFSDSKIIKLPDKIFYWKLLICR